MAWQCAQCRDLTFAHLDLSADNLIQGIQAGCKACELLGGALLWAVLQKDRVPRPSIPDRALRIRLMIDCALYLYLYGTSDEEDEMEKAHCLVELYTKDGEASLWPNIGPARNIQGSSYSAESVDLMRNWLQGCRDRHTSCHWQAAMSARLPSRVIDVGSAEDIPARASLYITKGEEGTYAALSHCWGGANPLRTTKSTLQSHQASVKFGPDSLTFAQAADVTRSLGIRYLWIDSLCIVQDDRDDWEAEAAKMKQVYRDATVTLSADGASDSSKGLFSARTLTRVSAHQTMAITTLGPNGESVFVYARLRALTHRRTMLNTSGSDGETQQTLRPRKLWPADPGSAPHSSLETLPSKLSTRAWVLQERVLSPRIIHFYEEELVWSCQSQQRCECRLLPTTPSSLGGFRRLLAILPGPKSARDLILEWPKLVEEFTGKAITFAEDRLPAISGLAALMHERTESKYFAGLWSKDLEYSLLWISRSDIALEPIRRLGTDTRPYAPTWSWASITGPILYVRRHLDQYTYRRSGCDEVIPLLKVLRASVEPQSAANIYGPASNGSITVRGQVLRIVLDTTQGRWRPRSEDGLFDRDGALFTGYTIYETGDDESTPPIFLYDGGLEAMVIPRQQLDKFVLLRAATFLTTGMWSAPSKEVVALLLVPVRSGPAGEPIYERRGIVFQAFHAERVWQHAEEQTVTIV